MFKEANNLQTSEIIIEVKEVFKTFKKVKAVNGISLKIREGEFVALLGPNGAGKTTLVEMIEGIQKPDSGEILILGKSWKGNEEELNKYLGISLQETNFIDKLKVNETLTLFASFYKQSSEQVRKIIDLTGLKEKENSNIVNLSGGQRQKLALGIALLNNPKILLLDEPTTGLDPNARREIWSILLKLKKEIGTSLILTTHYMEEAEQLCEYIIIMDKGRILKEGKKEILLANRDEEKIVEFTLEASDSLSEAKDRLLKSGFNIRLEDKAEKGFIALSRFEEELPLFLKYIKEKNIKLENFISRRKTLDDLFTALTGRHLDE